MFRKRVRGAWCVVRGSARDASRTHHAPHTTYHAPQLAALLLLLAACSRDHRTPLVIYSPHGRDLLTLFERRFEALHPDIDVRWLDMGSQDVYDRVRSERDRTRPASPCRASARRCRDAEPRNASRIASADLDRGDCK